MQLTNRDKSLLVAFIFIVVIFLSGTVGINGGLNSETTFREGFELALKEVGIALAVTIPALAAVCLVGAALPYP